MRRIIGQNQISQNEKNMEMAVAQRANVLMGQRSVLRTCVGMINYHPPQEIVGSIPTSHSTIALTDYPALPQNGLICVSTVRAFIVNGNNGGLK